MANGKGCICAAFSKADCGCDADWTPQELIDARAEIALLRLTDAERAAAMTLISCGEQSEDVGDQHAADTLRGLLDRSYSQSTQK